MNDAVHSWTDAGAFPVAPGVHRIPLPMPNDGLRAVNVYALDAGDGGCVLIDAGWALEEARTALEKALNSIGFGFDQIRRILVTHFHRDHYTLGVTLRKLFGTHLAIGIGEHPNIEGAITKDETSASELFGVWGAPHLRDKWEQIYTREDRRREGEAFDYPDAWIADGEQLQAGARGLTAIETPGHTRGHMVFLDPNASVLFTGDHVLPHITPSIGLQPARTPDPLGEFLRSLNLLLTHPDAEMLPAHGAAGGSVHKRVRELIVHHDIRLTKTAEAVTAGAGTTYEVARRLGWTRRETKFDDLDLFNQVLAIGETAAHLTVLVKRGQLARQRDGDGLLTHEPLPSAEV